MIKVITYGTFDLLHEGHINILRRAKELGDYLIVGLSTDDFNSLKGKKAVQSYEERKRALLLSEYVDEIIKEENWEQKIDDIHNNNIDIFVMGDDWEGKFDYLEKEGVKVIYFPRTPGVSSTQLRGELKN